MVILDTGEASLERAARALRSGELVGIPTETVYGLAALASNKNAVLRIFEAKGRPADNPLIVHIADESQLAPLVQEIPPRARPLMEAFWPGPLSLILQADDALPREITAGLATVAIRMPQHPAALALIQKSGPLAAPSANRSGRPSPTTAAHVLADMDGRIPYIIDDGPCDVGVESTVLDITGNLPRLLRPGGIPAEDILQVTGTLHIDPAVTGALAEGQKPASPGMKYRHYAPRARLLLLDEADYAEKATLLYDAECAKGQVCAILCFAHQLPIFGARNALSLGERENMPEIQRNVFRLLRLLDEQRCDFACAPALHGDAALAYMNRMLRASEQI